MRTEIVYEDKDILVIYKPAGLATQTAKIGQADVVSEIKNYLKVQGQQAPYLGVIHRLDQPVEGLLVFAKNKAATAALSAQLQRQGEGALNKYYYAVVCGKPTSDQGELVDYMYKSKENRAVIVDEASCRRQMAEAAGSKNRNAAEVKKAVLRYRVVKSTFEATEASAKLEAGQMSQFTKLDIEIMTGRFHQIRAQLAHIGLPLLGDIKYGSEEAIHLAKQQGVQNVALCAYQLELVHPVTKEKITFEIEPKGKAFSLGK